MQLKFFTQLLMDWHLSQNKRQMPWKGEKDPYKIWLSEIILQQTRVEQGQHYYEKFIQKFPTISHLANAQDADVFKVWEGLGYYNRCKNLLFSARLIAKEKQAIFPNNYDDILAIKGVGNYTAAAIASFAFDLPHAVVDGNVYRVLARFFAIDIAIDDAKGKKVFSALAEKLLDKKNAASYNQAIMDFGATICKPYLPLCNICPLEKNCEAYQRNLVNKLPIKEKILIKKTRWFTYFLFCLNEKVFVRLRSGKDIWQNLNEFYLIETPEKICWTNKEIERQLLIQLKIKNAGITSVSPFFSQQLTHQTIKGQFIKVQLKKMPDTLQSYQCSPYNKLNRIAFPQFINQYLKTQQ